MKSWKVGVIVLGLLLVGCATPVKFGGARIGDGKVDKKERGWLNMLRPGVGDQAQSLLGAPADEGPTPDEQLAALGLRKEFDMNITLNEGVVLKEGQRVLSGSDVSSLTVFPRWVPPELAPITLTPSQWISAQVGGAAVVAPDVETPAGKPTIADILGEIGK